MNFNKKKFFFIFFMLIVFPLYSSMANDDYNCTQFLSKQLTDLDLGTFDQPKKGKLPKKHDSVKLIAEWSRLEPIIGKLDDELPLLYRYRSGKYDEVRRKITQLKSELKKNVDRFEYVLAARRLKYNEIEFDNLVNFGQFKKEDFILSDDNYYPFFFEEKHPPKNHPNDDLVAYFKDKELVAYSTYSIKDSIKIYATIQSSNCKITKIIGNNVKIGSSYISNSPFVLNYDGCKYLLKNKNQFNGLDFSEENNFKQHCKEQGGKYDNENESCSCKSNNKNRIGIDPITDTCLFTRAPHEPTLHDILYMNTNKRNMSLGRYTQERFNLVVSLCEKHQEDFSVLDIQEAKIEADRKKGAGAMK